MKTRVHPKYKTKCRVTNWAEYELGLIQRGDVTVWLSPEAIAAWKPAPNGRRGGQRKFSDLAIETALPLRLVFHLPLRQAEGFLRSLFRLMGVDLEAPDHTTLLRRSALLAVALRGSPSTEPIHLVIDSSGLAVVGEGEWAAAKRGGSGRRRWKKLHLGVDATGVIVGEVLTDSNVDDGTTGVEIIRTLGRPIESVTADAAYDTVPVYDAADSRRARVLVPPSRKANVSRRGHRSHATDRTIGRVKELGRRRWKKEYGYHRQARVENTFSRPKTIIGDRLRARRFDAQAVEARSACNVLNQMLELAHPVSVAIGR